MQSCDKNKQKRPRTQIRNKWQKNKVMENSRRRMKIKPICKQLWVNTARSDKFLIFERYETDNGKSEMKIITIWMAKCTFNRMKNALASKHVAQHFKLSATIYVLCCKSVHIKIRKWKKTLRPFKYRYLEEWGLFHGQRRKQWNTNSTKNRINAKYKI